MARYTQTYVVKTNPHDVRAAIAEILNDCGLAVTFITNDYIMAQEKSGKVSFSKLITVEVLIHQPSIESNSIKLTCITKNGELPLRVDNHCQKMFDLVHQAFNLSSAWQLLDSSAV